MDSYTDIPDIPLRIIISMLNCRTILYKLPLVSVHICNLSKTIPIILDISNICDYHWDNNKLTTVLNNICSRYKVTGLKIPCFWKMKLMSDILLKFNNITHVSLKHHKVFSVSWVCMSVLYDTVYSIFNRLKYLDIQNWMYLDKFTDKLLHNNQLRHLTLPNSMLNKNSLQKLSICRHLTSLSVPFSKYFDDDIAKIISDNCVKLSRIKISCVTITDEGVKSISHLPLIKLSLTPYHGVLISGMSIDNIKTLKYLKLCRTSITDKQLQKILNSCLHLEKLFIPDSHNITDQGFYAETLSRHLSHVDIDGCTNILGVGILYISRKCNLKLLSMQSVSRLRDIYLKNILSNSNNLISLCLINCNISIFGVIDLHKKCPCLKNLYMGNTVVDIKYISEIVQNLPILSVLCIKGVGVTHETLYKLPIGLKHLYIDNTDIFYDDLCTIMERCPNITILSIQNIDVSSVEMYNFMRKYTSLEEVYVDVWVADTMHRLFSAVRV